MTRIGGDLPVVVSVSRVVFGLAVAAIAAGGCGESAAPGRPVKPASFASSLAKTFAEGHPVSSFDVGDVDGDGHLDVVASDLDHLAVFRGDGTGALANDPLDGGLTRSINTTVADVTGDGRADVIAAAVGSGNVRVFPGRADGTLGASIAYGIPAQIILRMMVVDMTGDGALDVLIQAMNFDGARGSTAVLAVLPNRGNGVFDEAIVTPLNANPMGWAAMDVDGDGATDVALTDPNLVVLMNDGRGHLSASQVNIDEPVETGALFGGDFDGDGRTDVLRLVDNGQQLVILRNLGGGAFSSLPRIDLGCVATDLVTADLNNDGRTDVVAVIAPGAVAILHGDGATLTPVGAYATGGATLLVRAGDVDDDGAVDLVVANSSVAGGNLAVLMNDGRGLFGAAPVAPVLGEALMMALSDVTGDGLADIVVSATGLESPALITLQSSREGKFRPSTIPLPIFGGSRGLAIGDLNGDHVADIVITSQSDGRTLVLPGNGAGQLVTPAGLELGAGENVAVGNLDGDAFLDVAMSSFENTGDVKLFSGQSNGSFAALQTYHAGDAPISALQLADLNGDGRPDVVGALTSPDGTGIISILPSSGPRAFGPPIAAPLVPPVSTFVVTDLDRDGRADLVGSTINGPDVPLLFGAARGRPFNRRSVDVGAPTVGVASADFNKDGWADLAFADQNSGDVLVLVNDGSGGFPDRQVIPLHLEPRELGAADLNGDGKVDLVVLSAAGVAVLWNNSSD